MPFFVDCPLIQAIVLQVYLYPIHYMAQQWLAQKPFGIWQACNFHLLDWIAIDASTLQLPEVIKI